MLRTDWNQYKDGVNNFGSKSSSIQQVYLVTNHADSIRAFHKHEHLVDFFIIVKGVAKFILVDDREGYTSYGYGKVITLTDKCLSMLVIPPGVLHGWRGDKDTILISVANELYMGENKKGILDETRIPYDTYGKEIWDIQHK